MKANVIKKKNDVFDFIKTLSFCIKKVSKETLHWEKIFTVRDSKGFISTTRKTFFQINKTAGIA